MRRRNREINIFNMSALDLFASALGAFILLFAILMPYYLKTSKIVMQENTQLKAQLKECQSQVADLQVQVQSLQQQLATCEQQKQQALAENEELKRKLEQMQKDLQQAQQSLDERVKFALLGINTKAQSFVLVVDMSGSMKAYTEAMTKTIARILEPFEDKHRVQIFGYREDQHTGVAFENWQSPYGLADMTEANKQAVNAFAHALAGHFDGGTPTQEALLEALKYDSEAIILLTDGAPTKGDQLSDTAAIVREVTEKNAGKKEIHTVAIGNYNAEPVLVEFLQALAAQNGGAFVGAAK